MLGYAMMFWLAGLAATGIKELATVVLGTMVQLDLVAVYVISAFIPTLIEVPLNALDRIATYKIASAWKENNHLEIKTIYQRSSHYLFLIGSLLFLLINSNSTSLLSFLPEKYRHTELLILILSVGTLLNMITGMNSQILFTSSKYYYAVLVVVTSAIASFLLQIALIPVYGIIGAALATALAGILINVAYTWIVWYQFHILPFKKSILLHTAFLITLLILLWFTPSLGNNLLNLTIRSVFLIVVYYLWIRKFNLMPEIMAFFQKKQD